MQPDEPAPVRFMNTIWADTAGVHDDLTSSDSLRGWLQTFGCRGCSTPTRAELAEARLLRDSLRRLAALCTNDPRPAAQSPVGSIGAAVGAVNSAAAHRPVDHLALYNGRLHRDRSSITSSTRAALADLAYQAIDLLTGPNAEKMCACLAPGCVLYFVRTHPRREWCSEACGNRVRAARHYRRNRKQSTPDQAGETSPNAGGGR